MKSPTKEEVREARAKAGLTQAEAGELVYMTRAAWSQVELGSNKLHPAVWELWLEKAKTLLEGEQV